MSKMEQEKLEQIIKMLAGLTKHEWLRIEHVVNKKYSSLEGELQLPSGEELVRALKIDW